MSCIACHSSWNPSCFGCHLPQRANIKMPQLHNEGDVTRNYVVLQLPDAARRRLHARPRRRRDRQPHRSGALVVRRSTSARTTATASRSTCSSKPSPPRASAASPSAPTCRTRVSGKGTTKQLHRLPSVREERQQRHHGPAADARHQLPQLHRPLLLGGAEEHGLSRRRRHRARRTASRHRQLRCTTSPSPTTTTSTSSSGRQLEHAHEHPGKDISDNLFHPFRKTGVLDVQTRGEYLYAACGEARPARLRHRLHRPQGLLASASTPRRCRRWASSSTSTRSTPPPSPPPTTTAPDPTRTHSAREQGGPRSTRIYGYLYVADKYEGLILVGAGTRIDGNPLNNFLEARRDLQPRRHPVRRQRHHHRRHLRLHLLRRRPGGRRPGRSRRIRRSPGDHRQAVPASIPRRCRASSATPSSADEEGIKVLDITDLAMPAGKRRLPLPTCTTSTWPGPTPMWPPASRAW